MVGEDNAETARAVTRADFKDSTQSCCVHVASAMWGKCENAGDSGKSVHQ